MKNYNFLRGSHFACNFLESKPNFFASLRNMQNAFKEKEIVSYSKKQFSLLN